MIPFGPQGGGRPTNTANKSTAPDRDGRAGGFFAPYAIPQSAKGECDHRVHFGYLPECPDGKGCARPGCIDAHVTPEPAEVAVEEREALPDALMQAVLIPGPVRAAKNEAVVLTLEEAQRAAARLSDWLRAHDAALTAKAKGEGAREALWKAADEWAANPDEVGDSFADARNWLRERADRGAS